MAITIIEAVKIVLVTFICSAILVPIIKKMALYIGAVDVPNKRKVHHKLIPRLGGVAIFFSFLLGYMLFSRQSIEMLSILIGSFVIIITGVIDDINPLPPKYKLSGQIIAALIVVFYGGILLNDISAFGFYVEFTPFVSYVLTILFIVGCINAINLVDGLDGLASGISSIYFLSIGIIAMLMGQTTGLDVSLTFIMLGSTLGFLIYNFYPAKIFMGDSGSMFLGFIISVIALLGFKNVTLTSLIVPLFVLAIPILDTLFAILRRTLKGQKISDPDREHLHHQLLNLRFSHRNTVLIIYAMDILFASASIFYVLKDPLLGKIIYAILLLIIIWFVTCTDIITTKRPLKNKLEKVNEKIHSKLEKKSKK